MAMFLVTLLVVIWILISGDLQNPSGLAFVCAIVSIILVVIAYRKIRKLIAYKFDISFIGFLKYLFYMSLEVMKADFTVTKIILTNKVSPSIIEIKNDYKTRYAMILYANSVTLTPGTITLDINEDRFLVHCLANRTKCSLEDTTLYNKVKKLEQIKH